MRALHIFPFFGRELVGGAERYEYMLSRKLVELGVEVEVLTTRAGAVRHRSAFSLAWSNDYPAGLERLDGIEVHRFANSLALPAALGQGLSRLLIRRWEREEARAGSMLKGSRNLVDYYHRRALARPAIYDWMAALGRGPHSLGLLGRAFASLRRCDVVLAGFMPFALVGQVARLAAIARKPLVILALFHPEDLYHHFKPFYRWFARADAVLAQTPYSTALFARLAPGSRPLCVGAGVDEDCLDDAHACGERFRRNYGLEGRRIVLFVGRKEPSKRYDLALRAIDLIGDERVRLVMIGREVDRQPISSPRVVYLGAVAQQDLADAYDACDVFLLPSEHESFGIVFLEAWMRRKPVIGNAFCRAVASVIRDGQDGYLCAGAEEIAGRVSRLLADPALARRLGEAGYEKVRADHTWSAVARRVCGLYQRLAAGRSQPPAPQSAAA